MSKQDAGQELLERYNSSRSITILGYPYNFLKWMRISIGDEEELFLLQPLVMAQGHTPETLATIFEFRLISASGFDTLGALRMDDRAGFRKLANLLGKVIHVRYADAPASNEPVFIIEPSIPAASQRAG